MAIEEFSGGPRGRASVVLVGYSPNASESLAFTNRKVFCSACELDDFLAQDRFALIDAVVFFQDAANLNSLKRALPLIPDLLRHDVRVYIRVAEDISEVDLARRKIVSQLAGLDAPVANLTATEYLSFVTPRERESNYLGPYVYLFGETDLWDHIAHVVCAHPAGNAPNKDLDIIGFKSRSARDDYLEHEILLQRSFADCSKLTLVPMTDGLSGAPAFKAFSETGSDPKHRVEVHFVKLGARKQIIDEYDNYTGRSLQLVPFHLGPRLRLEKCNLGSSQGILVGDFVIGAETIRDCAKAGRVGHAIPNLFNTTLGPWRDLGEERQQPMGDYLAEKWLDRHGELIALSSERAKIVRHLGSDDDVASAKATFDRFGHQLAICGTVHGDLHATNVLVRAGDSIIIDFEKMKEDFPLLYDPASLEGGFLTDGLIRDERLVLARASELLASIARLYSLNAIEASFDACSPADPLSWFFETTRQIRMLSRDLENGNGQYAAILGLVLIKKGCNPGPFEDKLQEISRAISFVLGKRIFSQLEERLNYTLPTSTSK